MAPAKDRDTERAAKKNPTAIRYLKRIGISLGLLGLGLYIFVQAFLAPIVKSKIINSVYNSSKGLYALSMEDFELGFWGGSVYMSGLHLDQDTLVLAKLRREDPLANYAEVDVEINEVNISRIWWQNFLFDRSLEVGKVNIEGPDFVFKGKIPEDTLKIGKQSFLDVLPGLIASFAGSLKIQELAVNKGKLSYELTSKTGISQQRADSIFITLRSIKIDTTAPRNVLYTDDVQFSLRNYELITEDELFKLNVRNFTGSYGDSLLKIDSIDFVPLKKTKTGDKYDVHIKSLQTTGIDFPLFFRQQKVSLGTMKIDSPKIDLLYHIVNESSTALDSGGALVNKNFLQVALPYVANTFRMKKLFLENGEISSGVITEKGLVQNKARNIDIVFNDIVVDTATTKSGDYWRSVNMKLAEYESKMYPQNLKLNISSVKASSETGIVSLYSLVGTSIKPAGKDQQLFFNNHVSRIQMVQVDFKKLFYNGDLSMKKMDVIGMKMDFLHDSRIASAPRKNLGKMPHELIRLIPIYVRIDQMHIHDAYFRYEAKSNEVRKPGVLTFEKTDLVLHNFTNDPARMTLKNPAIIVGKTYVMGQGELKLHVKLPLLSKNFQGSYTGALGKMEAKYFNSFLQYAGLKLESGTIEAQKIHVHVRNGIGKGDMLLIYHNLEAEIIEKKTGKAKKILSRVADLVMKNDNKKEDGELPQPVAINYRRKPEDEFFSYVWNSISTPIVETVVKKFFEPFVKVQ